jgi:hypothetical protein
MANGESRACVGEAGCCKGPVLTACGGKPDGRPGARGAKQSQCAGRRGPNPDAAVSNKPNLHAKRGPSLNAFAPNKPNFGLLGPKTRVERRHRANPPGSAAWRRKALTSNEPNWAAQRGLHRGMRRDPARQTKPIAQAREARSPAGREAAARDDKQSQSRPRRARY